MRRLAILSALVVGLCALGGCQRINVAQTWTQLGPGEHRWLDFSAPAYNQKLRITVTPTAEPVSVWVIKALPSEDQLDSAMTLKSKPPEASILGSKEPQQKEEYNLDVTVPAKTAYWVVVRNSGRKDTDVTIKIAGR
jgi:hypothetical protein